MCRYFYWKNQSSKMQRDDKFLLLLFSEHKISILKHVKERSGGPENS